MSNLQQNLANLLTKLDEVQLPKLRAHVADLVVGLESLNLPIRLEYEALDVDGNDLEDINIPTDDVTLRIIVGYKCGASEDNYAPVVEFVACTHDEDGNEEDPLTWMLLQYDMEDVDVAWDIGSYEKLDEDTLEEIRSTIEENATAADLDNATQSPFPSVDDEEAEDE